MCFFCGAIWARARASSRADWRRAWRDGNRHQPSFTILNVYDDGRIPLYHFDWYRLNSVEELYEMGMEEFLGGDGVAVVEWPSQCPEAIPETHLAIRLTPVDETTRDVTITPMGGFREISLEEEQ